MPSRMRRPETEKLDISHGDWLLVKKHLTAGESRAMFAGMARAMPGLPDSIDASRVGLSKMLAYLLDWSLTDVDGKQIVIRDQPESVVAAALDALDPEDFSEILAAIEHHEAAMRKLRVAEKNVQDGATASSAISPSVV